MSWNPNYPPELKRRWQNNRKAKPDYKEKMRIKDKEDYDYRVSIGICARSGCCRDARPNRKLCQECADNVHKTNQARRNLVKIMKKYPYFGA